MTERLTAREFHEQAGVDDWRVLWKLACARFRTGTFATGLALVEAIGALAEEAGHHPDVDLRYATVTVRMTTHDVGSLSERDLALARRISRAAAELGVEADPSSLSFPQLTIDARDIAAVRPFWREVLGYREAGEDLVDPAGHGPPVGFQQLDAPRPQRNRVHVDVAVPHELAEARIEAALAAGGRLLTDDHAPAWWVLADPEDNEACVATWQGRDG